MGLPVETANAGEISVICSAKLMSFIRRALVYIPFYLGINRNVH